MGGYNMLTAGGRLIVRTRGWHQAPEVISVEDCCSRELRPEVEAVVTRTWLTTADHKVIHVATDLLFVVNLITGQPEWETTVFASDHPALDLVTWRWESRTIAARAHRVIVEEIPLALALRYGARVANVHNWPRAIGTTPEAPKWCA